MCAEVLFIDGGVLYRFLQEFLCKYLQGSSQELLRDFVRHFFRYTSRKFSGDSSRSFSQGVSQMILRIYSWGCHKFLLRFVETFLQKFIQKFSFRILPGILPEITWGFISKRIWRNMSIFFLGITAEHSSFLGISKNSISSEISFDNSFINSSRFVLKFADKFFS